MARSVEEVAENLGQTKRSTVFDEVRAAGMFQTAVGRPPADLGGGFKGWKEAGTTAAAAAEGRCCAAQTCWLLVRLSQASSVRCIIKAMLPFLHGDQEGDARRDGIRVCLPVRMFVCQKKRIDHFYAW